MLKLLIANIKMTFRDKQAIFWTLVFPLMFIIIFGLFNFENMGDAKYVVIDNAHSPLSEEFLQGFEKIEFFKRQNNGTLDEALKLLKAGDIDFITVIPDTFKLPEAPAQAPPDVGVIKVYYDQSNITVNQVVLSVVDKFMDKMNLQAAGAPTIFRAESESVLSKNIRYIDIIMPGILAMAIMTSAVIGISTGISRYREQKLLKRLSATPIKVRVFLMAEVLSYLVVNLIQIGLIILLARVAFDVKVYGNYFILIATCLIGSVIFLNIGFAVAGYSKNTKTAEALSQVITMPMMFFSGVFFSTETLPKVVAKVVTFLPLTPLVDALRKVSIDAGGWVDIWQKLAFMGGWIIVSFLLAWRVFKFRD